MTVTKTQAQVVFGKPRSKNPEHVANVLVKFANGDYVRGIMIYHKMDADGNEYFLLRYPSYKNKNGNEKPFFKLHQAREKKLIELFLQAVAAGSLVEAYDLTMEETSFFSEVRM